MIGGGYLPSNFHRRIGGSAGADIENFGVQDGGTR